MQGTAHTWIAMATGLPVNKEPFSGSTLPLLFQHVSQMGALREAYALTIAALHPYAEPAGVELAGKLAKHADHAMDPFVGGLMRNLASNQRRLSQQLDHAVMLAQMGMVSVGWDLAISHVSAWLRCEPSYSTAEISKVQNEAKRQITLLPWGSVARVIRNALAHDRTVDLSFYISRGLFLPAWQSIEFSEGMHDSPLRREGFFDQRRAALAISQAMLDSASAGYQPE